MHPDIRLELLPVIDEEKKEQLYACDVMLTSSTFLNLGDTISVTHLMDQDSLLAVPPQHHLAHRIYPHTRTIAVTDSDCIFPIYAYHNRNNDNRAAELFYTRICEHFCK
ncbi:MAG: hypothetical protein IJJ03_02685 [Mogibacterium sp.]|nr:hypothetical protein [Mogibacterium sp.]